MSLINAAALATHILPCSEPSVIDKNILLKENGHAHRDATGCVEADTRSCSVISSSASLVVVGKETG